MGRPTLCTPELAERIGTELQKYGFVRPVLMLLGVPERTHYDWIERGETGEEPYATYSQTIKKAVAEWQLSRLGRISGAEQGWQSSAWSLERSDYATYGQRQQLEHSGSIATESPLATPAELRRRLAEIGEDPKH